MPSNKPSFVGESENPEAELLLTIGSDALAQSKKEEVWPKALSGHSLFADHYAN